MAEEATLGAASKKNGPSPAGDLSRDVEKAVVRRPLERVKCVRLFGDYYRCNWWAPQVGATAAEGMMKWGTLTTHHVKSSSFLHAVMREGKLVITENGKPGAVGTETMALREADLPALG